MDSTPDPYSWPRVGLRRIPDDVIIYILDFLGSTTLAAITLANRHLRELATPTLYRNITIPRKGEGNNEHVISLARLFRTLSRRPSLTVLVRHLENASPLLPQYVLKRVWSEHADPSDSQTGPMEQSAHTQLQSVSIDVMKSCVNLRSLTLVGSVSSFDIADHSRWMNFLLDSSISLKNFKALIYPMRDLETSRTMWNRFLARILDVQLSLEYLDFTFNNEALEFEEGRMEKWAPKLRVLGGSRVDGFEALLSNKRSIETVVLRSVFMEDIPRLYADRLRSVDTVKEIIYHGPVEDKPIDFPELFRAMPTSLKIFRGEMWLNFSTEDIFFQELLKAFALTPHLTEFDIRDSSCSLIGFFRMAQGDIFQTDLALHEEGCLRDQATWLARYSEVCPELRAFTFPDGTRWARVKDRWIPLTGFSRDYSR